jgi:hypothetical protein
MAQLEFLYDVAQFSEVEFDRRFTWTYLFRRLRGQSLYPYDPYLSAQFDLYEESQLIRFDIQRIVRGLPARELHELTIKRILHASPGFIDLTGLKKPIEQVRFFMTDIVERYLHRQDLKIAQDAAVDEVLAKKLENAKTLLKLSGKAGIDKETTQMLVRQVLTADYFLEGKVISGKITSVGPSPD